MNKEDLEGWLNSEVTRRYIEYIQEQIDDKNDLTTSVVINQTIECNAFDTAKLEHLGMESLARLSCIKGLEYAIDKDNFIDYCFGGEDA